MFCTFLLVGKNYLSGMRNVGIDGPFHRVSGYLAIAADGYETFGGETDKAIGNIKGIAGIGRHEDFPQAQCSPDGSFDGEVCQERIASAKSPLHNIEALLVSIERFGLEHETLILCMKQISVYVRYGRDVEQNLRLLQRVLYDDKLGTFKVGNKKECFLLRCKI